MSLDRLRAARRRTVGTKQTLKAVLRGEAVRVYVARDAEPHVVRDLVQACQARGVELEYVDTMRELGSACKIKVGAASAAILEE
ncbi:MULTISPECIES: ribosomal L7Ae/L30e/S12e/Gadd45 family protein [Thermaerobacter]|uniref:Ribosomal L7Ae/L30e/S12e/Gadd45 family protein n=1 Tax=Thermaerobacter composti TaxID=554949 RepID=A0ABZ0QNI4_9FIRM|nr:MULTISPECIES: ribosomal L7Ae/L30e/S12e/Gadd45 family protein [Thermaerobacter]PZN07360.1 MAG: 50S ribosomal protein L7Ae-like protein [Bacillota bacterium]QBS37038.1 50S ribosomal protein L7Ae-like protein [Thermaerobacter sp. FW80]WPD19048.1 ribosomal L7Ae/L30e/S12e/Gadd45 family protein [Thermaerobacter composti]